MNIKRKFKLKFSKSLKKFPYVKNSNSTGIYFRGKDWSLEKRSMNKFRQLLMRAKKHAITVPKNLTTEDEFFDWLHGA